KALTTSIVVLSVALGPPISANADSTWLDEPIQQWNQPGMPVPLVQRSGTEAQLDPRCASVARSAETSMDASVTDAGWTLFNPYEAGWGVALLFGVSGYDGMCRPSMYHAFVFVDGAFAGTLAPVASMSRTDGALTRDARIEADGRLGAVFIRYAPEDPLCCPSQPSVAVSYRVERTPQGPVVLVDRMAQIPKM
ncbi:MAG TPA: LppP/LprE family lipoprotein, partial [Chloroflexota bacterium]|nr:LppP/LprE family lipoprotein [Chloroflexota bacterium]